MIPAQWIAMPLLCCLAAAAVVYVALRVATRRNPKMRRAGTIACATLFLLAAVAWVAICAYAYATALSHGMDPDEPAASPMTALEVSETTPVADDVEDSVSAVQGKVLYLYKFGCPDCEAVYPQMSADLEAAGAEVLNVPSTSPLGVMLCERYRIDEVPALVAIGPAGGGLPVSPLGFEGGYDAEAVALAARHAEGGGD